MGSFHSYRNRFIPAGVRIQFYSRLEAWFRRAQLVRSSLLIEIRLRLRSGLERILVH